MHGIIELKKSITAGIVQYIELNDLKDSQLNTCQRIDFTIESKDCIPLASWEQERKRDIEQRKESLFF